LLDDLGDRRGYSHLIEEALDRIKWGIVLEEAVDLSADRLLMMMNHAPSASDSTSSDRISLFLLNSKATGFPDILQCSILRHSLYWLENARFY
jgi:hypothetical protein